MVRQLRTKGDIVTDTLSKMKISGITAPPDAEDIELMLQRLEGMLYEFQERGLCLEYNFTDDPNPADFHGMQFYAFQPISSILALRTLQDFGLEAPQLLVTQAKAGTDVISSAAAKQKIRQTQMSSRHPRGQGNTQRYIRWRTYYPEPFYPPVDCDAIKLEFGELQDFREDFSEELRQGETIMFIGTQFSNGLTYTELARSDSSVDYRIQAVENSENPLETVRFTVTTTTGRVLITDKTIEVIPLPEINT